MINWTLSNQTTRLLIKVSVPRGTDVGHAQQVLLDVVRANRDVSMEIPPAVLCLGLVDRTLEFEVSAFVDSFDNGAAYSTNSMAPSISRCARTALLDNRVV